MPTVEELNHLTSVEMDISHRTLHKHTYQEYIPSQVPYGCVMLRSSKFALSRWNLRETKNSLFHGCQEENGHKIKSGTKTKAFECQKYVHAIAPYSTKISNYMDRVQHVSIRTSP